MYLNKRKTIFLISIFLLVFLLTINDIKSQELKVVDGDTIHLNGEKIRFTGIDTPELKQICVKNGIEDPCGIKAKEILIEKIAQNKVKSFTKETLASKWLKLLKDTNSVN